MEVEPGGQSALVPVRQGGSSGPLKGLNMSPQSESDWMNVGRAFATAGEQFR